MQSIRISHEYIKQELEGIAHVQMEKMFLEVPFAREFHLGQKTDLAYFRRHLIETVVRMRLDIQTDAYALYKMRHLDNDLSKKFALYLSEESGHDEMFLQDIQKFGISHEEAISTKPLLSTENLIGFFYYQINHESPMLTVLWGWFVEWYSDNFNGNITSKAASEFGAEKLKGSMAHLTFDDHKDHYVFMLSTITLLIRTESDLQKAKLLIARIVSFLGDYFQELYDTTLGLQAKAV